MKKRAILSALTITGLCAFGAHAQVEGSYSWEDGGVVLGQFDDGNLTCSNSTEQAQDGAASLKMVEDPISGTPQAYVAYIEHLEDGDEITASFWVYDTTPGASPSGRIWAHYADSGDVNSYRGSASGNSEYSDGSGWSQLSHTWIFDAGDPIRDALVIEARIYSDADGQSIYVDNVEVSVTSSGSPTITFPGPTSCLDLSVENLVGGQMAMWTVENVFPAEQVAVVWGLTENNGTSGTAFGYCYDFAIDGVGLNRLIGQGTADGSGVATVSKMIPGNASGIQIKFQAAEQNTCPEPCMSNVLTEVVG